MRVAADAVIEILQLLMHHGVHGDRMLEFGALLRARQFAFQQQIGDLDEVRILRELVDRIAAIEQDALVAVDEGDFRFAAGGGGVAGVESEGAGLFVEGSDIDHIRPVGRLENRQIRGFPTDGEAGGIRLF